MNYSDRKYRQNIDKLINKSLNYVLNEVNNTQQNQNYFGDEYRFTKGTWSLDKDKVNQPFGQNDEDGYNTIAHDDYTIVSGGPIHSNWYIVYTKNGYQAWKHIKGHFHPIHYDDKLIQNTPGNFAWFDKCTNFIGSKNPYAKGYGGIFRKKEKKHYAKGTIDNVTYKIYADGTYDEQPYLDHYNYKSVDSDNNETTGNYYNEGMVNSDGTYTTSFIQDPNNQKEFNPNKFLRIRFDDRSLLQKFFYIWGNTMNNSNRGNNLKVGYNDNGGQDVYYFIDMPNGPGIYDYVINLYDNLENGTIKYNEIDKNVYRDTRSQTQGKRQNPYNISGPNEPAQFSHINEDIEEKKKKNKKSRQGKNNYIQTSKNPSISTTSSKQEQSQEVNQNNYSDDYSNNQYQDEQQSNERPDIIVFGNRIEAENNIMANLPDPKTLDIDLNDNFYGLFTNNNNQKFYYRFNDKYVYVSVDNPYLANNLIGEYSINNNLLQMIIYKSSNIYEMNYDIKNIQNVSNINTQQTVGTMQFWQLTPKDRDPFYGALNENKIIKQIIKEFINEQSL